MDENLIITNHSILQYYIYTNGNIFDREIIKKNILTNYNMSMSFINVGEFNINKSNRYTYYLKRQHEKNYLLSINPRLSPILINDNTIIKSDTLADEEREIVNLLFKIKQFVIVKNRYNKFIGLADKFIIFYNVQYGENELITYNIEDVMDITTITIEDMGKLIKIKERFFNKYGHEWDQFLELVQVCNKIFSKEIIKVKSEVKQTIVEDKKEEIVIVKQVEKVDKIEEKIIPATKVEVKKESKIIGIESKKTVVPKVIEIKEDKKDALKVVKETKKIKTVKNMRSIKLTYDVDIHVIEKVYENINNKQYTIIEKKYIVRYISMMKGTLDEREFNRYWSKANDDKTKKNIAKPILRFLFEDILEWDETDIYNQFTSSLLMSYKLDKMLMHVFNSIAIDTVIFLHPKMKIFLFKSLNLFTWYYIRSKNGVEHAKETIHWIIKIEKIEDRKSVV